MAVETLPEVTPDVVPEEDTRTRPKRQPPYAVVLHNDDVNGFEFVIGVLGKVFKYSLAKASWLTLKVHCNGRGMVWSGTRELAELKAEQVRSCGPDPSQVHAGAGPLRVTIEPLPE